MPENSQSILVIFDVDPQENGKTFEIVETSRFEKILKSLKRQKSSLFRNLAKQLKKISREPYLGKPLRNILRNRRRIHVGSFVLLYEIYQGKVYLLDFDHHERIYKKYE